MTDVKSLGQGAGIFQPHAARFVSGDAISNGPPRGFSESRGEVVNGLTVPIPTVIITLKRSALAGIGRGDGLPLDRGGTRGGAEATRVMGCNENL